MEDRIWHQHYDSEVPTTLDYPEVTLNDFLTATVHKYGEHPAIHFMGSEITYRALDAAVDRLATGLQGLGVGKGDRVSVFMANCPQTVIAYEAIWRIGGVAVPSNPLYTASEFAHQAADAGSKVAICLTLNYDRVQQAIGKTSLEHVVVTNIKEHGIIA